MLILPVHAQAHKLPSKFVRLNGDVAPAEILRFGRAHARIAHNEHEVVSDRSIPCIDGVARLFDPIAGEGVQLTVFIRREFLTPCLADGQATFEYLALADVLLAGSITHDTSKGAHLAADGRVAHASARSAFAVGLSPHGIFIPLVLADQRDLRRSHIAVELGLDVRIDDSPCVVGDLTRFGALLVEGRVLLRHLAEAPIEHGKFVFDLEAKLGVMVKRLLPRLAFDGCLQGDSLVAILARQFHAAVPIVVLHVGAAEDDEARL